MLEPKPITRPTACAPAFALTTLVLAFAVIGCDSKSSGTIQGGNTGGRPGGGGASGNGGSGGGNIFTPGSGGMGMTMTPRDAGQPELPAVMEQGMAKAKFCSEAFGPDGTSFEFTLELGTNKTRFTTRSGECTPARGADCTTIAAGTIPWSLLIDGQATPYQGVLANLPAGARIVVVAVPTDTGALDFVAGQIKPDVTCQQVPGTVDAGAGDGGGLGDTRGATNIPGGTVPGGRN